MSRVRLVQRSVSHLAPIEQIGRGVEGRCQAVASGPRQ